MLRPDIDLLLDSQSFSDFLARVETVKEISEHDQQIIDEMVNLKTGVETSRDEIVKARDEQKEARALVDGKKGELDKKLAQKKAAVESLENDIEKDEKAYQEAKDAQESLKKSLASSLSSSSGGGPVYSGGEFCFPAPSYTYVSSEFGYRIPPYIRNQTLPFRPGPGGAICDQCTGRGGRDGPHGGLERRLWELRGNRPRRRTGYTLWPQFEPAGQRGSACYQGPGHRQGWKHRYIYRGPLPF